MKPGRNVLPWNIDSAVNYRYIFFGLPFYLIEDGKPAKFMGTGERLVGYSDEVVHCKGFVKAKILTGKYPTLLQTPVNKQLRFQPIFGLFIISTLLSVNYYTIRNTNTPK